jgi:hypothetical protein
MVQPQHTLLRNVDTTPPVSRAHSETELQQDWQREQTLVPALSYRTPREKQRALQAYGVRMRTHTYVYVDKPRLTTTTPKRACTARTRVHSYD